jgi:MFS superfamily sulfate permease-like transporter
LQRQGIFFILFQFMKRRIRYYRLLLLKHDLPAGLSVFFVALPLCLGIALASGVPLYAGILSGVIGGLVVSLISGSSLGVSGPAAGLTTVVASAIVLLGDYRTFVLAIIIAGIFQLILGLLRLGSVANYFPSSVIKGMLAAIGIILIAKQIPVALAMISRTSGPADFLPPSGPVRFRNMCIILTGIPPGWRSSLLRFPWRSCSCCSRILPGAGK